MSFDTGPYSDGPEVEKWLVRHAGFTMGPQGYAIPPPRPSSATGEPAPNTPGVNIGVSGFGGGGGGASATAVVDGRNDKPAPLSRWYAKVVDDLGDGRYTVELSDDSAGASTITIPAENSSPSDGDRVIVDFRPDGLAVISAVA